LSADTPPECKELRILQDVTDSTAVHKGRDFVIRLHDNFVIEGPNGKHLCLVTAVAGERLARKPGLPYDDLEWPRAIGLQIAQALGYLHMLGIAHGGERSPYSTVPGRGGSAKMETDCYTSNILFQLLPFNDWSDEDIYACIGQPIKHYVRRLDGGPRGKNAPEYTVDAGNVAALQDRLFTNRIILIDFGGAFYHSERPVVIYTPAPFASPEIVFGGELTHAVDKWAFGCLLYELCANHSLIKLLFGWKNDAQKDQVAMLGKPPDALWQNWEARDKYFNPNGTPREAQGRRLKVQPLSLEQRVRNLEKPLSERGFGTGVAMPLPPNLQSLYDLLKGVIIYDAGARLSFEQIQAHPFFIGADCSTS
jgi:serine/threonine protein kinase